ncbi:MAG TPA: Holliday junction branch migration protein RuvA [Streptosporangiaceae bacterium]|nr:Holliday junction branch migration protein RuvA [Streptosporangiaceae bacterium]
MIAHVDGTVSSVTPDGAVVDVGGVGLAVQCTPTTLAGLRPGERARVPTSLVVREDALTLYGFADDDERTVFELLQTASGVGPRLALAMLGVHRPDALRRAVAAEDLNALMMVPGIGKKGAQRIVLELAGRLGAPGPGLSTDGVGAGAAAARAALAADGGQPGGWRDQLQAGLTGLGWSPREAEQAVAAVEPELAAMAAASAGEQSAQDGNGQRGNGQRSGDQGQPVDLAVALRVALRHLGRS